MISVTKLNNSTIIVNADLIEYVEKTPDTLITLTTGKKIMVTESLEDIITLVLEYRSKTRAYPVPTAAPQRRPTTSRRRR